MMNWVRKTKGTKKLDIKTKERKKMKEKKDKQVPMKQRIGQAAKQTGLGTLGVIGGTGVAAGIGKFAPFVGLAMLGAGYFLGGKWQLLTVAGAATLGYGIAKSQDNRVSEGLKERFVTFKNDWMHTFYIDKLMNKRQPVELDADEIISGIGAIDTSALDDIEESIKESAVKFQMNQMEENENPLFLETSEEESEEEAEEQEEAEEFEIEDLEIDFNNF